jgi:hypothetical protein
MRKYKIQWVELQEYCHYPVGNRPGAFSFKLKTQIKGSPQQFIKSK